MEVERGTANLDPTASARASAASLERLVPDELAASDITGHRTLELHLARYELAARYARGRILDMACGVGYGTRLLADRGRDVVSATGVDLAGEAIAYARSRYARDGVTYEHCDAVQFADADGFDTVVSLETIEHVPEPAVLFARLVGLLRRRGILIASVPTTPSVDVNPHHLHDFTERSFRALGEQHGLREIDHRRQVQPYSIVGVLSRSEQRMETMRANLVRYYVNHPWAAVRRAVATARFGFSNRYLTLVWRKP